MNGVDEYQVFVSQHRWWNKRITKVADPYQFTWSRTVLFILRDLKTKIQTVECIIFVPTPALPALTGHLLSTPNPGSFFKVFSPHSCFYKHYWVTSSPGPNVTTGHWGQVHSAVPDRLAVLRGVGLKEIYYIEI